MNNVRTSLLSFLMIPFLSFSSFTFGAPPATQNSVITASNKHQAQSDQAHQVTIDSSHLPQSTTPCYPSQRGHGPYNRTSILFGLKALADESLLFPVVENSGQAAKVVSEWVFTDASTAQINGRQPEVGTVDEAKARMEITGILVNGLTMSYNTDELIRTECITGATTVSTLALTVAAFLEAHASLTTLYAWSGVGLLPILALDISGYTNSAPLYKNSAEALQRIHNRYGALYASIPNLTAEINTMNAKLATTPQVGNCAAYLNVISANLGKKLGLIKTVEISDTDVSLANTAYSSLMAECTGLSSALQTIDGFSNSASTARMRLSSLFAQDAISLDYDVTNRERSSRPAPHEVIGIIIAAPFAAVASAISGGKSYSSSASWNWSEQDINLSLQKIDPITVPSALVANTDVKAQLTALDSALNPAPKAAPKAAVKGAKPAPPPPVCPPEPTSTQYFQCQIKAMIKLNDEFLAAVPIINPVIQRATATQTTFTNANALVSLNVRIGSVNPDPVSLTIPSASSAAPAAAPSTSKSASGASPS